MNKKAEALPEMCYGISPFTHDPVRIIRGENNFYGMRGREQCVYELNKAAGVSKQQQQAMMGGVIYGWNSCHADLSYYTTGGKYQGPKEDRII